MPNYSYLFILIARQYHSSLAVIIRLKASQGPQEYVVCYGPGRQALDADWPQPLTTELSLLPIYRYAPAL